MARKRNEQTIAQIRRASRRLILEEGYEACTYSALAEATGIARTTIQHYVPRKEALAAELMQAVSDVAYERATNLLGPDPHPLELTYVAGQVSSGIYHSEPGLRRFLHDVLVNRELQHDVFPRFDVIALDLFGTDIAALGAEDAT